MDTVLVAKADRGGTIAARHTYGSTRPEGGGEGGIKICKAFFR